VPTRKSKGYGSFHNPFLLVVTLRNFNLSGTL
jgi:hypothetical protein